jgi:predicted methyltransferase
LSYRVKLALFLASAVIILFLLNTAYQGLNTLSRLNAVEAERDQWQRPSDVMQALDLRPGNVVVDLGCGSGYFTLKLSAPVGKGGSVLAGRLVVVDRGHQSVAAGSNETAREHHEVSSEQVESELRHAGFEIVRRQDRFIESDPSNETWWLITASKP